MGKGPASSTDVCKTSSVSEASSNSGIPTQGLDFQTCRASIDTRKSPPGWYHRLFWEDTGQGQGHWDTTTACHHLEEAEACYPAWERAGWGLHYIQLLRGNCWEAKDTHFSSKHIPNCSPLPSCPEAEGPQWGRKPNCWDGMSICDPAPVEWPLLAARAWGARATEGDQLGAIQLPRSVYVFR